jgi:tetratricopeptide (TPR) repeat protein
VSIVLLCALGCAHEMATDGETVRLVGGRRVVTRYISPSAYQHYIQGQLYAYEERHAEAIGELRQALVNDPDAPEIRARLGEELLAVGQLEAADAEVAQALRADPGYAPAYLVRAALKRARGDLGGAVTVLREAVHAAPTDEDAAIELARAQHDAGDVLGSRATLRGLCERVPDSLDGHFHYGNALAGSGDLAGGAVELRRALDLDPTHTDARTRLAEVLTASGRLDEAIGVLRDGLDRSDDNLPLVDPLVELLLRMGDLEGARDAIGTVDREDGDAQRAVVVANLLRSAKLQVRARELVETALRQKPDLARARLLSAALYEDARNPQSALAEYRKIPADDKDFADATRHAVDLLTKLGKPAEAQAWVVDALKRHPDDEELVVLAAELDERRGDVGAAVHRLEVALGGKGQKGEALVSALATTLDHAGEWRRGVELMRKLLAAHPDSATALNFVGYALAEHGVELPEAERLLRRAVALAAGNGYILDSLGWCLYRRGRVEEALTTLQQADRMAPDEPEILRHLGEVYRASKDRTHALESYRRALDRASGDDKLKRELEAALRELEADRSARRP